MPLTLLQELTNDTRATGRRQVTHVTKSGEFKRRFSLDEKIEILGQGAPLAATKARLNEFIRLFAYRWGKASITRVGQGPRAWTKLPQPLSESHVVRHLLANQISTLSPIWVAPRSCRMSPWLAIDVDDDRTKEQILEDEYDLTDADENDLPWIKTNVLDQIPEPPPRPTFEDRCLMVERAFRRLGIDPADPRQVLIQQTPSGGRHYYVFLDDAYLLYQIHDVLNAAGLQHKSGEIEFFPSTRRGLRLPFGYLPGQPHDPNAWIQFIDDYRNRRIHRHSLQNLYDHLDKHDARWARQAQSRRAKQATNGPPPQPNGTNSPYLGPTKAERLASPTKVDHHTIHRYRELLAKGIHSFAEAEELMQIGIHSPGTRTEALKLLVAHLIWFKHHSAEETADILTTWAMDPRHKSKDIAHDLAHGTNKVATQIVTMCRWYTANNRNNQGPVATPTATYEKFSRPEIEAIHNSLKRLHGEDRRDQAHFLLHALAFAKHHGQPSPDNDGWDAAPAVRQIIRRWPGCHHMNYKKRIDHATAAGVLNVVKEKWQNRSGKGRARTYRLHVPVIAAQGDTLDYSTALAILTAATGPDESVRREDNTTGALPPSPEMFNASGNRATSTQNNPPPLPEASPERNLGTGPHQRNPQRDAPDRLLGQHSGIRRANRGRTIRIVPGQTNTLSDFIEYERKRLAAQRAGITFIELRMPLGASPHARTHWREQFRSVEDLIRPSGHRTKS